MTSPTRARVLIVAHRTAATPKLLAQVKQRAERGPCDFALLVPALPGDQGDERSRETLELAIPLLEGAAKGNVEGIVGDSDPLRAVQELLDREQFDEVIVSTLPERVSRWLKRDLPASIERLGVPVTVVKAEQRRSPMFPSTPHRGD